MIGQLRSRVKFEQNAPTTLGAGKKDSFTEVLTTWGKLEKQNGDRQLNGLNIELVSTHTLWVRLQSDLETVMGKKVKVVIDNRKFTIVSYEKVDQKKFFYKFKLKESE